MSGCRNNLASERRPQRSSSVPDLPVSCLFVCFLSPRATEETGNTCSTKAKLKRKGECEVIEVRVILTLFY